MRRKSRPKYGIGYYGKGSCIIAPGEPQPVGTLKVMNIPLTHEQYCSVLRKAQEYPNWNSLNEETRKVIIQNHVQMNYPKSSWQWLSKKERETYVK